MKKCLIIYYSQSGTTEKIAEQISSGLKSKYKVTSINIRDAKPENIGDFDLIGIGSPVYFFRPVYVILNFIKGLPQLGNIPFFVFLLYGTHYFNAYKYIEKIIKRKGGNIIGYNNFKGEDLFLGYLKRGFLFSPDSPKNNDLARAEKFGYDIIAAAEKKISYAPEGISHAGFIYALERLILTQWLTNNVYSRFFKADKNKCDSCGICIKVCPSNNISKDKSDRISWGRNCLICLSCGLKCPKDAITSPADWFIMRPFLFYNVQMGSHDPSIEFVKVKIEKGKVKKVKS